MDSKKPIRRSSSALRASAKIFNVEIKPTSISKPDLPRRAMTDREEGGASEELHNTKLEKASINDLLKLI